MSILERFGRRLRELRLSRNWTESDLADRWGLDVARVAAVELGKREVRILELDQIAQALGMSVAELLEGRDYGSEFTD